ncbi:unknown [Prevotella sp. CAG:755]|nr:unknown [Prevotella sp. CAG:755]
MTATRFHTSNIMLPKPVATVSVYSLAKNVSVEPF